MRKLWTSKALVEEPLVCFLPTPEEQAAGQARFLVIEADGAERTAGSSYIFHNLVDTGCPSYPAYPASTIRRLDDGLITLLEPTN